MRISTFDRDLVQGPFAPLPRVALVQSVQAVLGVTHREAERITEAFDTYVAQPMESKLTNLHGRDLAKRNPMIYTSRGTTSIDERVSPIVS